MIVHTPRHRLFWSGGFDSTARLLDLLGAGERVEVHYAPTGASSNDWQKNRREAEARRRILAALPADWRARVSVAEPMPFDWQIYAEIVTGHYQVSHEMRDGWFSSQGPLLAACARLIGGSIEAIYVGRELPAPVAALFRQSGVALPWLGVGKPTILREAQRAGVDAVLGLTWSCEGDERYGDDTRGPCGNCSPCKQRIIPARIFGEGAAEKQQSGVTLAAPHVQ